MGGPFVEMKCSTPCDEGGSTLDALAKLVQDDAAQGAGQQGDEPGPRRGLVSGDGGHSPGGLAALAATDWEAGSVSITCTCESAGRPTGVAAAIAEVSAGLGWLRTLETVGRSWVKMVSTRRFAAGSTKSLKCLKNLRQ